MPKPEISFVMPTRDRRGRTLETLAILQENAADVPHEVIVIDNASSDGTAEAVQRDFPQVRLVELSENLNSAARNLGISAAEAPLVCMLDDDSWPEKGTPEAALNVMANHPRLAVAACYVHRHGQEFHEMGGLPGVFIGCGAVLRKDAATAVGGYPTDYGYYVEEYDLCARLWQAGWQVRWVESLRVCHNPAAAGRDKNRILKMLAANNLRLWSRFAPVTRYDAMIEETIERYRKIAQKEAALAGYQEGLAIGLTAAAHNNTRRRPLTDEQFDGMFGLNYLRQQLEQAKASGVSQLLLWRRGKGAEQILETASKAGVKIVAIAEDVRTVLESDAFAGMAVYNPHEAYQADVQGAVVGSLSPGASLDLLTEARSHLTDVPVIDPVARTIPAMAAMAVG